MQTDNKIVSMIFNPETIGGVLIRLYVAGLIVAFLSIASLVLGGGIAR